MKKKIINQKGFAPIVIILVVIGILALGGASYYVIKKNSPQPTQKTEQPTSTQPSSEKPSYKEPEPMPAPQTIQQSVKFDLPAESPLNNENLKLSSFYGSVDVSGQDIKSHKILSIKITDNQAGQLLTFGKELDSEKMKYDLPIYIEKTDRVYSINTMAIAKGLVWTTMMFLVDSPMKPIVMTKISNDYMFTKTIMYELEYLIETKPEEIGGDFQGERGERLIKLVTKVIDNNLRQKDEETKTSADYYDCGTSKTCFVERALICKLTKAKISESGITAEHLIKGEENGKCFYYFKILESTVGGFAGLEMNCKFSKEILSNFFVSGVDPNIQVSNCSGSYIDFIKKTITEINRNR